MFLPVLLCLGSLLGRLGRDLWPSTGPPGFGQGLRVNPIAGPGVAEIGYWIRSDRHRRGFATQAVRAATAAVFRHLPAIDVVEIRMDIKNRPSVGVASAAGFVLDREIDREVTAPGHAGRAFVWLSRRHPQSARLDG